jgi:hypothetical protein
MAEKNYVPDGRAADSNAPMRRRQVMDFMIKTLLKLLGNGFVLSFRV